MKATDEPSKQHASWISMSILFMNEILQVLGKVLTAFESTIEMEQKYSF